MAGNKAVFLDRDGVILEDVENAFKMDDFQLIEGVLESLRKLRKAGYKLFIITNQPGIAKGIFTEEDYAKYNSFMLSKLNANGITIEGVEYCPYLPDAKLAKYKRSSSSMKPGTQSFEKLIKEYSVDTDRSFVIGDKDEDIIPGKKLMIKTIFIEGKYPNNEKADYKVKSLKEAVDNVIVRTVVSKK